MRGGHPAYTELMSCNKPYTVYRSRDRKTSRGKPAIEFKKSAGIPGSESQIACGQCTGCRLEHSRIWAIRNMHENQMHNNSQYVTLTYNDNNLPHNQSLYKPDLQRFFKRLRKDQSVRYYACGEYGDTTERPHYHAIIYGLEILDREYYKTTSQGHKLYKSKYLSQFWKLGHVILGEEVNFETCAYVARYIMKKQKGKSDYDLQQKYERIDRDTGLIRQLLPEYQTMSRRPGIGFSYFKKFASDIYQSGTDGQVVLRGGMSCKSPTYYDNLYAEQSLSNQQIVDNIKEKRRIKIEERAEDNTPARLKTKESIAQNRANKQLPRTLN